MSYELSISFKVLVKESPFEVYDTFTISEKLSKLNGALATIENKEEGTFTQLDGIFLIKLN